MTTVSIKIVMKDGRTMFYGVRRIDALKKITLTKKLLKSAHPIKRVFLYDCTMAPSKKGIQFGALYDNGKYNVFLTDCITYILNDRGKVIERIN